MNKIDVRRISAGIKKLAQKALNSLSTSDPAYKVAHERLYRPIDYMRCAEFYAISNYLSVKAGMRILDVSSPQWFSMYHAAGNPETEFDYINIIDAELDSFRKIAQICGLNNLHYHKGDARALSFKPGSFDKIISMSVIEHIYPEVGGDAKALGEIKRVLVPTGELLITVPYKDKRNIVYVNGPVYEREAMGKSFFAREYDKEMFDDLVAASGFKLNNTHFIIEKPGLFSPDYYKWGPGRDTSSAKYIIRASALIERILRKPLDEPLARRYLRVSPQSAYRLVNIAARLVNSADIVNP